MNDAQCERVYRILRAGRRKLMAHVRARVHAMRSRDALVADETLRIATLLYGFGKPASAPKRHR